MTHITISDRVIAVEVENGCTGCKIHTPHAAFFAFYDTKPIRSAKRHILPPDKTYKFLCLASDIVLAHHAIKLTVDEIVDTCDKLDKDKEYALIEVQ